MGLEKEAENEGKKVIKRPDNDHKDPNTDHDHDQQCMMMNINHGDEQVEDKALGGHKKSHNVPPNTNKNKRKGVVLDMTGDNFSSATRKRQRGTMLLSGGTPDTSLIITPPRINNDEGKQQGQATKLTVKGGTSTGGTGKAKSGDGQRKCEVCKRSFSSYQALGGHMSKHNDKNIKIKNRLSSTAKAKSGDGRRTCELCKRSFSSYQALGGHMSKHNDKNIKINNRLSSTDVDVDDADDDDDNADEDDCSPPIDERAGKDDKDDDDDGGGGVGVSARIGGGKIVHGFDLNKIPAF